MVDTTTSSFVFEVTGGRDKIDSFVALMREVGLVEVGRTGIVAHGARGARRPEITHLVIPAKAGAIRRYRQLRRMRIPAFAGMTTEEKEIQCMSITTPTPT